MTGVGNTRPQKWQRGTIVFSGQDIISEGSVTSGSVYVGDCNQLGAIINMTGTGTLEDLGTLTFRLHFGKTIDGTTYWGECLSGVWANMIVNTNSFSSDAYNECVMPVEFTADLVSVEIVAVNGSGTFSESDKVSVTFILVTK